MYEPRKYWESLLDERTGLQGVADPSHAEFALQRGYQAVQENVLRLLTESGLPTLDGVDVLDIGSGSGFWLDMWTLLGARSLTGVELTTVATERLRASHPEVRVVNADISAAGLELAGPYGLISAMNVMLHVVHDEAFRRAINTMSALLRDDGVILVADPILVRRSTRHPAGAADNSVARTLAEWESALSDAGLQITHLRASTVLQGNPIDVKHRLILKALSAAWWMYGRIQAGAPPAVARLVVRAVAAADRRLTRTACPPISAKLAVVRRAGAAGAQSRRRGSTT